MSHYRVISAVLRSPTKLCESIGIFLVAMYRAATVRFLRGLMIQYPPVTAQLARKIPATVVKNFNYRFEHDDYRNIRLILAVGYLNFKSNENWRQSFNSHEEFVSLHRWNWLLRDVNDGQLASFDEGMALVKSWLSEIGVSPKGDAGESYTVGERISNLCLFARQKTGDWHHIPSDIQQVLRFKAKFLAHRLEYLPGNLTGNHLVNNARALLLAGHCCDLESASVLSRTILSSHLGTIIDDRGFLREGSSHYQFLVTRWLLEIRLISEEMGDFETLEIIKEFLPKMVNACKFFLVEPPGFKKDMVLFGDISPDCEPSWLIDITRSALAQFNNRTVNENLTGWAGLFQDFTSEHLFEWPCVSSTHTCWDENITNGWYRLDYLDWVAIWHVASPSGAPIASHAHYDFGSPVVYFKGKEILIDVGRFEYENNQISNYGLSAQAHTVLMINGIPMVLSRRDHRIPEFYRDTETHICFKEEADRCEISIEHDGFKRIRKNVGRHTRKFIFTDRRLTISDLVQGSGEVLFETFFQFPKLPKNFDNNQSLGNPYFENSSDSHMDLEFEASPTFSKPLTLIGSEDPLGGWRFKSFGTKEAAVTVKLSALVDLPFESTYEIFKEWK